MATSNIAITEGTGAKKIATRSLTEDAVVKEIQRVELNNSSGAEIGTSANPIQIQGNIASDAADSGNPIKTGGKAVSAEITAVTANDRVDSTYDLIGRQVVAPYALPQSLLSGATSDITNTTATTIIAGVASNYLYITQILVTNSHATVGTFVNITEETSGTVLYTGYASPVGGGFSVNFPTPLKVPTAGKSLQATCATTGSNTRVSAVGYKSTI